MFNKTEERDYFVNPDCFGDDVCFVDCHGSGFLSAFGIGKKEIAIEALQQIHQALSSTQGISAIRWHEAKKFNKGIEDLGMPTPD
ncbi:MAG: hypothetical protein P4L53_12695 [Candidatus Obscuribacterales bacterium]|nr:hypothetical protein [Candidatus Obscuribacterales bacterium]